jgi:drug/metabolite transporter (DMT)-like permease
LTAGTETEPLPGGAVPRRLVADLALVLVTIIWGSTFVMVKNVVASYPPFSFLTVRFTLAALALVPFVWFEQGRARAAERRRREAGEPSYQAAILQRPAAPLLIGLALFVGYACQTLGLQLTTPAKAGFITGSYVVIVPVVMALVLRQKPGRNAALGVALALVGLALLSLQDGLTVSGGDALVLVCAVAFAVHILLTGRFALRYDPMSLTFGQIVVVAGLSGVCALALEPRVALTREVLVAAAFTGLLATSAAFGIQVIAQRFTTSTHTALIFAGESVFAALASYLLIREVLGPRQLLGCALILGAIVVAELKEGKR